MVHLPEFAAAFLLNFFVDFFVNALGNSCDNRGFLPTANSNSATEISSSRVMRFGPRRWYSSLKAR
jgi:hypothetical protein